VRRGAVVPEGDAAGLPAETHRVLRPRDFVEEQAQQVAAFLFAHVLDAPREARVDEQHAFARVGQHPHHGVLGHQRAGLHPLRVQALVVQVAVVAAELVPRPQPVGQRAHRGRQVPVRNLEIGEHSIAAVFGHLPARAQDGSRGRIDHARHVGVPALAAPADGGLGGNRADLRIAFGRVGVVGMRRGRPAEMLREGQVLRMLDVLVAEEHDLPAPQRRLDLVDLVLRQWLPEVHAVDLGAGEDGKRPDIQPRAFECGHVPAPMDIGENRIGARNMPNKYRYAM